MEHRFLNNVSLARFREVFKESDQIGMGDDFCIVNMKFSNRKGKLNYPFRFDGILLVWCIKGHLKMSVNLNEYDVTENKIFVCVPGNIFKLNEIVGDSSELHYVCLAMSKEFASEQKVDVSKLFSKGLSMMDDPSVTLTDAEAEIMAEHIKLMGRITCSDMTYRKDCLMSLWASMRYVIAGLVDRRAEYENEVQETTNRNKILFDQFIRLVANYHTEHRNVGFYADKLCLTPKYLSKLIKSATGRSAPEWIDAYVILEAKNLLKYSNESIKEIVYRLNFPNQSVFYKFFKARTGMTPSEYRNS